MLDITKQILNNNLPISDVTRTVTVTGSELDNPVFKWYNKDTKKWYFGDKWSQKCNFSPNYPDSSLLVDFARLVQCNARRLSSTYFNEGESSKFTKAIF